MRRFLLAVLVLAAAAPLAAQHPYDEPLPLSRFDAGISGAVAQPVGAFADQVGVAGGGSAFVAMHVSPVASIRLDGSFLLYGHERRSECSSFSCRVILDLDTNYQIASGFIGPQLEVPTGAVRPYVHGGVGFAYFFTSSSLSGSDSYQYATTTNFSDATFAGIAGGGLRIPFAIQRVPVAVDLGARYQHNGRLLYLRKGTGIVDNGDGTIRVNPTDGEANFVLWHIGATVTIPQPRD